MMDDRQLVHDADDASFAFAGRTVRYVGTFLVGTHRILVLDQRDVRTYRVRYGTSSSLGATTLDQALLLALQLKYLGPSSQFADFAARMLVGDGSSLRDDV